VKSTPCSEYTVGDTIGKYQIEKIVGRGFFFVKLLMYHFDLFAGSFGAIYMVTDNESSNVFN
jgi:hypothetical protein